MLLGKEFGPYVVQKEIGSGAMGSVYLAVHKDTGEKVAVKLISPALLASEAAANRFIREIATLKKLSHPNIVKYKGSGRYHGTPFYIMEYFPGESLDHVMARRGRMSWEEVVDIGVQLCAALQHAHEKSVIHRDLKPSNLMMSRDGLVKLTDFGIAKDTDLTALTAANSTVGTAAYMSPEQCRGSREINHKSDLYSMGIMFYELVTGRKPFTADTAMEMFLQHANKRDYPRPAQLVLETPPWLNTIIDHLMEKEPDKRPFSAEKVADELKLVKDKVAAQTSAGADAAKKRRMDKSTGDKPIEEQDKDTARAMIGKKKKKKKADPFYRQGWFTVAALAALAFTFVAFVYFIFIRTPSAESLHARVQTGMKSEEYSTRKEARDLAKTFLDAYPQHALTADVQKAADDYDIRAAEVPMLNLRAAKRNAADDDMKKAWEALDLEDLGRVHDAYKRWDEMAKLKGNVDAEKHAWGLVGEKYRQELQSMDKLYNELRTKIASEKILEKKAEAADDFEQTGLSAVREELSNRSAAAKSQWEDLRKLSDEKTDRRRWFLLATKRLRELRDGAEK
jgi:serine/threonine protein kinase